MPQVVLYRPEIPPNTGNIIRLCANTGTQLHLIGPLKFSMQDADLKRASLAHSEYVNVKQHSNFNEYLTSTGHQPYLVSSKGVQPYHEVTYSSGDVFMFGNEAWGIPSEIENQFEPQRRLKIPQVDRSRCLNLANAVAVVLYEVLRQTGFKSLK